jgi:hypothetical protein
MDWQEARDNTIRYWKSIRDSMNEMDQIELLSEINAVNDLCEKAKEESHGHPDRCSYCLAYQQFGGCMGISLQMSECVVEGRMDELRELVDRFIDQLEEVKLPEGQDPPLT